MNVEHAIQTIAKRGFTERQARFVLLVARHSGVCVMRQYSTFAGIVFGQKTRRFFANLVRARLVSTYDCAHSRGRVYHLRHRAIYEAIGDPARLSVHRRVQAAVQLPGAARASRPRVPRCAPGLLRASGHRTSAQSDGCSGCSRRRCEARRRSTARGDAHSADSVVPVGAPQSLRFRCTRRGKS
jgi:hypothetical protein